MLSAGNSDILIAAYAIANDLTALHSGRNFGYLDQALDAVNFRQEFIAE